MINICILGVGKVGTHLIKECINNPNINLIQIYNRSSKGLALFKGMLPTTQSVYELKKADIYIVALPDTIIQEVDLNHLSGLVVHTSGTVPYKDLKAINRGVLYPLQSFSKEKNINFKKTPFCLETENEQDYILLESCIKKISDFVYKITEFQRQKLHLAAVFANNFSNRVLGIAYDICKEQNIDFNILQPLIQETFLKAQILPPHIAQTGPALRRDKKTTEKHLSQLNSTDKEVYKILTKSIQEKHDEKL